MGRVFEQFLDDAKGIYACNRCTLHFADDDELISRSFQVRSTTGNSQEDRAALVLTLGPLTTTFPIGYI